MKTVDALSDGKAIEFDFDISTKSDSGTNKNQQGWDEPLLLLEPHPLSLNVPKANKTEKNNLTLLFYKIPNLLCLVDKCKHVGFTLSTFYEHLKSNNILLSYCALLGLYFIK